MQRPSIRQSQRLMWTPAANSWSRQIKKENYLKLQPTHCFSFGVQQSFPDTFKIFIVFPVYAVNSEQRHQSLDGGGSPAVSVTPETFVGLLQTQLFSQRRSNVAAEGLKLCFNGNNKVSFIKMWNIEIFKIKFDQKLPYWLHLCNVWHHSYQLVLLSTL